MKKQKLFIDMDGTLTEYRVDATLEDYVRPGFYESLRPNQDFIDYLENLQKQGKYELYVLTIFIKDYSREEKERWNEQYVPFIPADHCCYVEAGTVTKDEYLKQHGITVDKNCILIDDHTPNLLAWERAGGTGLKAINGINGRGLVWQGKRIDLSHPKACRHLKRDTDRER